MSRVCGGMLLVIALVFCVTGSCSAGAMYQNTSGALARAIRIEFSEPAEIAWMYPSFPQRNPQGASTVIVLSGGEVPAGGWFSFSWRPDTVRVVQVDWLAVEPGSSWGAEGGFAYSQAIDRESLFEWDLDDLKGIDPADASYHQDWGSAVPTDIVVVYLRAFPDALQVRVDFLDAGSNFWEEVDVQVNLRFVGTAKALSISISDPNLCIAHLGSLTVNRAVYGITFDSVLDALTFFVDVEVLHANGLDIRDITSIAVLATCDLGRYPEDKAGPFLVGSVVEPVLLVYQLATWGPGGPGATWGDILEGDGSTSGYLRLLEAVERWEQPVVLIIDEEFLIDGAENGHIPYLKNLQEDGLLEISGSAPVGFSLPWQDPVVGAKAINWMSKFVESLGLRSGPSFAPYEAIISRENFATIASAGFSLVTSCVSQFYNWFGRSPYEGEDNVFRLHEVNGLLVAFFQSCMACDIRQGTSPESLPDIGRRKDLVSLTPAVSGNNSSFAFWYDDAFGLSGLWPWLYPGPSPAHFDACLRWIAAHPWVRMVTFAELLARGLTPVPWSEFCPLEGFHSLPGDRHYLAYYPLHYYGGIADGSSPNVRKGEAIEGYAGYVPVLAHGEPIPSMMPMGDAKTPGTLVHEIVSALKLAPEGGLTELAWYGYFVSVCAHNERVTEDGSLGGRFLPDRVKRGATWLRKIGAVLEAAQWEERVRSGTVPSSTQVLRSDLDWDGEDEIVMANDLVFAVFENDGGRLELLVAYYPDSKTAVPIVYPAWLLHGNRHEGEQSSLGEAALFGFRLPSPDAAFIERGMHTLYYECEAGDHSVRFTSPDGSVVKTFSLQGGKLDVLYQADNSVTVSVGLCVNPLSLFAPAPPGQWRLTKSVGKLSVTCAGGGSVRLTSQGLNRSFIYSFLPSEGWHVGSHWHTGWYRPYVTLEGSASGSFGFSLDIGVRP